MDRYLLVFAAGIAASSFVFTCYWMGHFGWANLCGTQPWQVCTQQWLAAGGPTAALIFAGIGAKGLQEQVRHGQIAARATEREQLRHEFQTLTSLRDSLLADQRELEAFERVYTDRGAFSYDTPWDELEKVQYEFDGFVEWLGDARRDPYLFKLRSLLSGIARGAFARSELFRNNAERWKTHAISRERMALSTFATILITIGEMEKVREEIDRLIIALGEKVASVSSTRS